MLRLLVLFVIVLALSIFGAQISLLKAHYRWQDLLEIPLSPPEILTILMLSILLYLADAWRFSKTLKVFGQSLSFSTCLEASIVNFFFAWITPGGALGAPSAIVLLQRKGISFEKALLVAYNKSLVGIYMLLLGALAALVILPFRGIEFQFSQSWFFDLIILSLVIYVGILLMPFFLLNLPSQHQWLKRWPLLEKIKDQLSALRHVRLKQWGELFLVHAIYFFIFIGIATVICQFLGSPSMGNAWLLSTIKLSVSYVAPTPGGSGIAEMTALDFYGGILPPNQAILAVICFRSFTFYLQMIVGGFYFTLKFSQSFLASIIRMSKQGYR